MRAAEALFVWKVGPDLEARANRFVRAFNTPVPGRPPDVVAENAHLFFDPDCLFADVAGRCVRIGVDPDSTPVRHYHWAICMGGGLRPNAGVCFGRGRSLYG